MNDDEIIGKQSLYMFDRKFLVFVLGFAHRTRWTFCPKPYRRSDSLWESESLELSPRVVPAKYQQQISSGFYGNE